MYQFICGIYGAKINHLIFITIWINITASLIQNTQKTHIRLEPLPLASVPLINMPSFNSPSMNFQAAKGIKKFFLATELWIVAYDTWRSWNGFVQVTQCIHHTFPVVCSGSRCSWERWFILLSSLPPVSSISSPQSNIWSSKCLAHSHVLLLLCWALWWYCNQMRDKVRIILFHRENQTRVFKY